MTAFAALEPPAAVMLALARLDRLPADAPARDRAAAQAALRQARADWLAELAPALAAHRAAAAAKVLRALDDLDEARAALVALNDGCRRHGLPVPQPPLLVPDLSELRRLASHVTALHRSATAGRRRHKGADTADQEDAA